MLSGVEGKDSRFISGLKLREKPLRVYRGQWDILIILLKRSVFLVFTVDNQ